MAPGIRLYNGGSRCLITSHLRKRLTPNPAKPHPIVDFRLMIVDLRYRFALSFISARAVRESCANVM